MEQRKGKRLVMFPLPLQGHITPMLQLANILHSKGFSITIIHTNFNSPNPKNHPHFTFHFINENLTQTTSVDHDLIGLVSLLNVTCVEPFRECLSSLLLDSEEPIACVISDAILPFAQEVANQLKVPRIVLRTGGASSFLVFNAFPLLRENGYFSIQDYESEKPIKELPPLRVKDLPVINTCTPEALYQLVTAMVNGTRASSGVIFNTFQDLEQCELDSIQQELGIPVFPIGPFHKYSSISSSLFHEDESCISWLDKQAPKSVVYVSFGSIAEINETNFLEIAWGLSNSNQPFLWVVRPGLVRGALPDGFLESSGGRGKIVTWAPQCEVLGHSAIGAFWSHNGWNSTLESICEGVPMICMPCFTDQKVNARYVSHVWKVGVHLDTNQLVRENIKKTIRRLMDHGGESEEIRHRSLELKMKADLCLRQDGCSWKSLDNLVSYIMSLKSFVFQSK
ncbi:hypothetical protein ACFE04_003146 [Oxalis oulophora]